MMPYFCGDDKKAYSILISLDFHDEKMKKIQHFCYLCVWMKNNKILRSINLFLS